MPKTSYINAEFTLSNYMYILHEYYDPNPTHKKDLERRDMDCTIRAFCKLLDKDWGTVAKELFEIALENNAMPNNSRIVIKEYAKRNGYMFKEFKDKKTSIAGIFIGLNRNGKYLVLIPEHIFCVDNGVVYDTIRTNAGFEKQLTQPILGVVLPRRYKIWGGTIGTRGMYTTGYKEFKEKYGKRI